MAVPWNDEDRKVVDAGMARHPVTSNRCAALARVVFTVGHPYDMHTRGVQVRIPRTSAARFLDPKVPHPPRWEKHTYVETQAHAVDAMTGTDGYASEDYRKDYWKHPDFLEFVEVDLGTVDPGIEDDL